MSSSLDRLSANLPKDKFKYTCEVFKKEKLELMTQKGVYPYDFMDSFKRLNETQLPSKDDFFSKLTQDAITDEKYCHATKVWGTFNLKTMGDYHDLYLKSDILLLADVFKNFRSTCLQYYKLDPCHYYTSGLRLDAMLKMTDIKLELMTDIDMFQFIEKGTRGGISYIANRFGEANNIYMKEYNKEKPTILDKTVEKIALLRVIFSKLRNRPILPSPPPPGSNVVGSSKESRIPMHL